MGLPSGRGLPLAARLPPPGRPGRRWLLLLAPLAALVLLCCLDPQTVRGRLGQGLGHLGVVVERSARLVAPRLPRTPAVTTVPPEVATGFLVDTPGCRIPFLAPLDEAVRQFVFPRKAVNCSRGAPALVEADRRLEVLRVRRDRAHLYNVSEPGRLSCCVRPFWRPAPPSPPAVPDLRRVDQAIEFGLNCTEFPPEDEAHVSSEFVHVECVDTEEDVLVYRDLFGFTPSKPLRRDSRAGARQDGVDDNNAVEDVVDPDTPRVSVLIVGADSVSRNNLLRQMPKTVQVLKDVGAIDMLGYNKVEDNTFPNLVAVLTGLSVAELQRRCWPTDSTPFDECPFIWKRFASLGYRTAYGEDEPWMGIFNYIKTGFVQPPVHYYMRPYASLLLKEVGSHHEYNCHLCTGPRFQLEALLDYAARFSRLSLPGDAPPLFGLFWGVSLTHDQLNTAQLADPLFASWLTTAHGDGVLEKSVVVFLSDHGIRWGDIRETYQGRLEERLPFLWIALPRWVRERYPFAASNLRRNSRRLVTPYDLHATLEDLMDLTRLEQSSLKQRADVLYSLTRGTGGPGSGPGSGRGPLPRGISMFLVAPETRSCEDAGIEPHWCTCSTSTPLPSNHSVARRAASFVVSRINAMLSGYRQCERLALDALQDARLQESPKELAASSNTSTPSSIAGKQAARAARGKRSTMRGPVKVMDYALQLRTSPGGALFEATVRVRSGGSFRQYKGDFRRQSRREKFALTGTISRINRYGSQSACVADFHMKLYCYCKGQQTSE